MRFSRPGWLVIAAMMCVSAPLLANDATPSAQLATQAQAILQANCYKCHGPKEQKGELRLDVRDIALRGGQSGEPAIVPGKSAESLLPQIVRGTLPDFPKMPPQGEPLSEDNIKILEAWIDAGAPWPAGMKEFDPASHWAYRAPKWPKIPEVSDPEWAKHPIDAFIRARLEKEGLEPAPEADRATLIRRVSLDLTGLPPTPEEAEAFINDTDPRAYEKLIDRLLASPAYGERWAVQWLDIARYADSNGFEKDAARVIWPYRDWVINALNEDKPFDQFVIEQLAGDMLPGATLEQIVATGFNRNSMINEEGGVDPEEAQAKAIYDRIDTTSTAFLATTVACAQCHDHKYDPISQKDYYSLYAIFNQQASDFKIVNTHSASNGGPTVRVPTIEQRMLMKRVEAETEKLKREMRKPDADKAALGEQLLELSAVAPRDVPTTMVMREVEEPRATQIHKKGDFRNKGEAVDPATPAVMPKIPEGVPVNRLTFARWLVSPENPLTARVFVNRVWEQYFGFGIVKTTEDFGTQGERPVHPELLDWLALRFQFDGWSMKSLHRLIVTSRAYRQASAVTGEKLERDPDNRLLARGPRYRLPAEMIRDQALAVSGLLSRKIGGPSVFPHQPEGVWKMPYSSAKWKLSEGEDRFRRGLYTWAQRTAPYPSFQAFDAPTREAVCTRRARSNTPLQALVTLNDPVFMEAAQALARRVVNQVNEGDDAARMEAMFRACLVRAPNGAESERLLAFLKQQREGFRADEKAAKSVATAGSLEPLPDGANFVELAAWTMVANVILNLDEVLTKS